MKRSVLLLFLSLTTFALSAQIPSTHPTDPNQPPYPNTSRGSYVKDGQTHDGWFVFADEAKRIRSLLVTPSDGGYQLTTYTPDMISGYTLYEVQETYISARIETEHGTEWLFFKHVLDLKDGTRVACIPAKAMENTHDIYYRIDDTRATTLEVGTASGQMWDVFAEDTGFRPTNEAKVHHVRKPKSKELLYSYRGYTTGNEKMFNRHKFGVLAGVGMSNPYLKGMDKKGWKYTLGPFYSAGIFARFQVGRDMSVEPQLLFSHISEESEEFEEFDLDSPAGRTYLDVSTLQIPLLFRVHDYSWASDWTLYAELGPALAVNFVTKQESLSDGVSRSDDTTFDIDCLVGAGVEYHFNTRQTLSMGIRYSLRTTGYGTMKTLELVAGLSLFNF